MPRVMLHVLVAAVLATAACSGSSEQSGPTRARTTGPSTTATTAAPSLTGGHTWRITYRSNSGGGWQSVMTTGTPTRTPAGTGVSGTALRRCGFDPASDALLPLQFVDTNPGSTEVPGSGVGFRLSSSIGAVVALRLGAGHAVRFVSDSPPWSDDAVGRCPDLTRELLTAGYFDERTLAPGAVRTVRAALVLDGVAPGGERSTLAKLWLSVPGNNGSVGDTERVVGPRVGELGTILIARTNWYFPVDGTAVFDCASATNDRREVARCRATPAGAS